jgi:hypothetical protein
VDYVQSCREAGLPIEKCRDIREAVRFLQDNKLIKEEESFFFLRDGWRREFHWSVSIKPGQKTIRIASTGSDGVDHHEGELDVVIKLSDAGKN